MAEAAQEEPGYHRTNGDLGRGEESGYEDRRVSEGEFHGIPLQGEGPRRPWMTAAGAPRRAARGGGASGRQRRSVWLCSSQALNPATLGRSTSMHTPAVAHPCPCPCPLQARPPPPAPASTAAAAAAQPCGRARPQARSAPQPAPPAGPTWASTLALGEAAAVNGAGICCTKARRCVPPPAAPTPRACRPLAPSTCPLPQVGRAWVQGRMQWGVAWAGQGSSSGCD
jgi:hypothetical protein